MPKKVQLLVKCAKDARILELIWQLYMKLSVFMLKLNVYR